MYYLLDMTDFTQCCTPYESTYKGFAVNYFPTSLPLF